MVNRPLESEIENYLAREVTRHGGFSRKLAWTNQRNAPDRLVFLRRVYFVELKRPGEKPRKGQLIEHELLRSHDAIVLVIDTKEKVDRFIKHATRICTKTTAANWVKSLSKT